LSEIAFLVECILDISIVDESFLEELDIGLFFNDIDSATEGKQQFGCQTAFTTDNENGVELLLWQD